MTRDEVDAFFAVSGRTLSSEPAWREATSRSGERRAEITVAVGGRNSPVRLGITVVRHDPSFLSLVLLAPSCIARLCNSTPHFDAVQRRIVEAPHFHAWHDNRPAGQKLPVKLGRARAVPPFGDHAAAFAWFLRKTGIESPEWRFEIPLQDNLF